MYQHTNARLPDNALLRYAYSVRQQNQENPKNPEVYPVSQEISGLEYQNILVYVGARTPNRKWPYFTQSIFFVKK